MTLYLIDANVLIRAHEDYYPVDRIPAFWTWLYEQADALVIKMPFQIYNEVSPSQGLLAAWIRQEHVRTAIVLDEPTDIARVQHVLEHGYGPALTDVDIEKIGRDPFLIAAALGGNDRVVVTREVRKPSAQAGNRKIPDVCDAFGVVSMTDFELYRKLRFSIR